MLVSSAERLIVKKVSIRNRNFTTSTQSNKKTAINRLKKRISKLKKKIKQLKEDLDKHGSCSANIETQNTVNDFLTQENILLIQELDRRNSIIESQQDVNQNLLDTLSRFKSEINMNEKTIGNIKFIERQLHSLKDFVDTNLKDNCKLEETNLDKSKNDNVNITVLTKNDNDPKIASLTDVEKCFYIYSDKLGCGLASRLRICTTKNVTNFCSPGASFRKLLEDLINTKRSSQSVCVVVIGETPSKSRKEFKSCVQLLNDISKQNKIIICTMPYKNFNYQNNKYNDYVYALNTDLYNMTCDNSNVHIIDININRKSSISSNKDIFLKIMTDALKACIESSSCTTTSTVINLTKESTDCVVNNINKYTGMMKPKSIAENFQEDLVLKAVT